MTETTIYALCCPESGSPRYVGKTTQRIGCRLNSHLRESGRNHRGNWIRSLTTRGLKPEVVILEVVSGEGWAERERFWISEMTARGCELVNGTVGGEGAPGRRLSAEVRALMSERMRGRKHGPEAKEKVRAANTGRVQSEEVRRKHADALRGKPKAPEHAAKVAAARMGWHPSAEQRARMGDASRGRRHTDEAKAKIGAASRGRKPSAEAIEKRRAALIGRALSGEHRANLSRAWTEKRGGSPPVTLPCGFCGEPVTVPACRLRRSPSGRVYCNRSCAARYGAAQRSPAPPAD